MFSDTPSYEPCNLPQDNSVGRDHKLIIINHAIIYGYKLILASTYFGRCRDNCATEDAKIGFRPPGDRG
jgi:hypothetical protein